MALHATQLALLATAVSVVTLMAFTLQTASSAPAMATTEPVPPMTSRGLLTTLLTSSVTSSTTSNPPTSSATSTTSGEAASACPQTKLASSSDWLATQGSWSHPCTYSSPSDSTSTESNAALSSFWSFFVLAAPVSDEVDGSKVVVLLQEAADIVENLREKLGPLSLQEHAANITLLPESRDELDNSTADTDKASNTSSLVEQEYWRVSVALVYLEQCGYDADQCSDDTSLRETFNELEDKLLTTLCKMRDVLDALKGHIPEVTRDVMPLEIRDVPEDNGQRAIRDLVIAGDVREMLQAAEVTFKNL